MSNISAGIVDKATLQDAAEATGNGYTMDVGGKASLTLQVTGTFSGTVTFEASLDGSNWVSRSGIDGSGNKSSTATTTGIYQFNIDGIKYFRARISAYTSGSITVIARATPFPLSSLNAAMELESLVGEVQNTPTNYTVLGRLKTVHDNISSTNGLVNGVRSDLSGLASTLDKVSGKVAEGANASSYPLLIGYRNAAGKAIMVSPVDAMPVQLSGSYVKIGGVTFAVSGGDTLRNTATNKPDAATAHAAIPFCYYHAVDTGVIEVTDGTNWVVM